MPFTPSPSPTPPTGFPEGHPAWDSYFAQLQAWVANNQSAASAYAADQEVAKANVGTAQENLRQSGETNRLSIAGAQNVSLAEEQGQQALAQLGLRGTQEMSLAEKQGQQAQALESLRQQSAS